MKVTDQKGSLPCALRWISSVDVVVLAVVMPALSSLVGLVGWFWVCLVWLAQAVSSVTSDRIRHFLMSAFLTFTFFSGGVGPEVLRLWWVDNLGLLL